MRNLLLYTAWLALLGRIRICYTNYTLHLLHKKVSYRKQIARQHFVVDRVKICFISSLITLQKLFVVWHVCALGGPKNLGDAGGPRHLGIEMLLLPYIEICFSPPVLPCQIWSF